MDESTTAAGEADLRALSSLAGALARASSPREVGRVTVEAVAARFPVDVVACFMVEGDVLVALACSNPELQRRFRRLRVPVGEPSPLGAALRRSAVVRSPDLLREGRENRWFVELTGIRAGVAVPLTAGGTGVGVLLLGHLSAGRGAREVPEPFLGAVAHQTAVALDRLRLLERLRVTVREAERNARQLEDRRREVERLVFLVSHDLRTPVVSIQNFLHYLNAEHGDALPEGARFYLGRIEANCEHLNNLIRGILDLQQVGRQEPMNEEVELGDVVAEVLANLAPQVEEQGAQVELGALPAVVGNRTRLLQVFQNLMENALDYGGPRGGSFRIRIGAGDPQGGQHRITVWNSGPPLPRSAANRIFDPFYRLPEAVERNPGGSGAGLTIVKRIVEAHGGRVGAEPQGEGTLVWFTLPAAAQGSGD